MARGFNPTCLIPPGTILENVDETGAAVVITVRPSAAGGDCPGCGGTSHRVYSRYTRSLAYLPMSGRSVMLKLFVRRFCAGFIPAWAGQPCQDRSAPAAGRVHPRVGGAAGHAHRRGDNLGGSSPRGRGSLYADRRRCRDERFIPAWAGQPTICGRPMRNEQVHPRVGGAAGVKLRAAIDLMGSSPRGRGSLFFGVSSTPHPGFIPAWAGQPSGITGIKHAIEVHPRVGGAARWWLVGLSYRTGSSPRGRGSRGDVDHGCTLEGFIPAWAGQPI